MTRLELERELDYLEENKQRMSKTAYGQAQAPLLRELDRKDKLSPNTPAWPNR